MAKVLIAEDEEAMLEIFGEVIENLGYTVDHARNGQEALILAQAELPDLIVSDQMMPLCTGLELLRALRADPITADVPFLLISAAEPKGAEEADLFLSKPFELDAFEAAVRATVRLRGGRKGPPPAPEPPTPPPPGLKEEILNWVAHEMKTPLAAARLNAQLLIRRLEEQPLEEESKRAHAVVRQLDRMQSLVTSILDAARVSEGRVALDLAPVDLSQLAQETASSWRQMHPEVAFHVTGAETPHETLADATHLRTILDNLLGNSVKHAGSAGVITLNLGRTPSAVVLEVQDQGPGIPASELPRLFERFYRAKVGGEGHGLGLYIASSLARLHGGALSVQSGLGQGSTFALRLPIRG